MHDVAASEQVGQANADVLFRCLAWISTFHGDPRSAASWRQGVASSADGVRAVLQAAHLSGYSATLAQRALEDLPDYVLPAIVLLTDGHAAVVVRRVGEDQLEVARHEGGQELLTLTLRVEELQQQCSGYLILVKPPLRHDARAGQQEVAASGHWFWGTLWRFRAYYRDIAVATVVINVLTLAGIFFTMNVYDRVVPAKTYPTLWTLALGTVLAICFELGARELRSLLIDKAGKQVDLILGAMLFRQAMNIRLERRPASAGSFAHQVREFESLREFTTSATAAVLADLPFALVFLLVIVAIAGVAAWVPLVTAILVIVSGVLVQWPLARYMRENLRQSALKQGLLVEVLDGIETIKAVNGQSRMQRAWEDYSAISAISAMKSRQLTSFILELSNFLQQISVVALVVWGVYLIHENHLSQGALVAAVMLSRQAISPLTKAVGLAVRFQQAKASLTNLNRMMSETTDREPGKRYLACPRLQGSLSTDSLEFFYPQQTLPAVTMVNLQIAAGEKVAILGRIGCGKSTLLRLLSGLYGPSRGVVQADGIDMRQFDPADVHRQIGLVTQDCKLFHGSLRDNVMLGWPDAPPDRLLMACRVAGLNSLIQRHPLGLDMMLGEDGVGLSGGQRQQVALARALVLDPAVLLMDEPTSTMDAQSERAFIDSLLSLPGQRTLVIATHRLSLLELVDRVVVLEQGRVIADGPKQEVLAALQRGMKPAPRAQADKEALK